MLFFYVIAGNSVSEPRAGPSGLGISNPKGSKNEDDVFKKPNTPRKKSSKVEHKQSTLPKEIITTRKNKSKNSIQGQNDVQVSDSDAGEEHARSSNFKFLKSKDPIEKSRNSRSDDHESPKKTTSTENEEPTIQESSETDDANTSLSPPDPFPERKFPLSDSEYAELQSVETLSTAATLDEPTSNATAGQKIKKSPDKKRVKSNKSISRKIFF